MAPHSWSSISWSPFHGLRERADERADEALVAGYMENAALIRNAFVKWGYDCIGDENSPYIWIRTEAKSWAFFDRLLQKAEVVCTSGSGFGKCGEHHVRISAFNSKENVVEALSRIEKILQS